MHLPPGRATVNRLTKDERQQAKRTGIEVEDVSADLTAAWQATRSGQAFGKPCWKPRAMCWPRVSEDW